MATENIYPTTTSILTSLKQYTVEFFYEIKNQIRDQLGNINYFSEETQELFEKMSQSVPQCGRKKKFPTDDEWRKKKSQFIKKEAQDNNEKNYQELKSYLNKISISNYQVILEEINKLLSNFQENKEEYLYSFLTEMFKKARTEPTYCVYYIKIIVGITDRVNVRKFIHELKDNYNQTIIKLKPIEIIKKDDDDNNTEDDINEEHEEPEEKEKDMEGDEDVKVKEGETYDEFCISRKHKNYQKGFSQFIGELFNAHQFNLNDTIAYYGIMVNNIMTVVKKLKSEGNNMFDIMHKEYHKIIEENVLYLAPLVESTIENILKNKNAIQNYQIEKLQTIFNNMHEVCETKIINNKNRYQLIDLVDLFNKFHKILTSKKDNDSFRSNKPYKPSNNNHNHHTNNNTNTNNNRSFRK
jgi:hypothetical protein